MIQSQNTIGLSSPFRRILSHPCLTLLKKIILKTQNLKQTCRAGVKQMKKMLSMLFFVATFFFMSVVTPNTQVFANEMSAIEYEIELLRDGSGIITEYREMYLTRDTEIYIILDHLEGSEVIDFHVSDFGEPLNYEPDWNIDASREEKAGKYGIVETSNGYELCWGIGEYGEHEYMVTYTITDLVRQLKDGQSMNWQFFDGANNINPEEVGVRIFGPDPFTVDDTLIWGFGFEGEIYLEDGELVGWSESSLGASNYITILMQFLNEPFNPDLALDQTLAEQSEKALSGSQYSEYDDSPNNLGLILGLLFSSIGIAIAIFVTVFSVKWNRVRKRENALVTGKKREDMNEGLYYRDIPYKDAPITDIAFLLQEISRGKLGNYFSAYMLKWLNENRIRAKKEETGRIFKKETTTIIFDPDQTFDSGFENRFWDLITSASDSEGILRDSDMQKWAQKNYKDIQKIDQELNKQSKESLEREGYIEEVEVVVMAKIKTDIVRSTQAGERLFNHIVQFKNYLSDFSLLSEREMKEVALWDDLLIWASLYGIAEQVAEQLQKFYPKYYDEAHISYADVYLLHAFSTSMSSGYNAGRGAASGGGGSTSIGGGGGSFGGGGGGSR